MVDKRGDGIAWEAYATELGDRIAATRIALGVSQRELADRAGLHRNQVSNIERGTSNREPFLADPMLSTIYRIAKALDCTPGSLLPAVDRPVAIQPDSSADIPNLNNSESAQSRGTTMSAPQIEETKKAKTAALKNAVKIAEVAALLRIYWAEDGAAGEFADRLEELSKELHDAAAE